MTAAVSESDSLRSKIEQGQHWLTGHYQPVTDELDTTDLVVTGQLPAGLRGTFLRNGPNPAFAPLGKYHVFDGDGMLHGLHFDGEGGVRYRNRWIESQGLAAERAAGHALYGGLSEFTLPAPEVVAAAGITKNTANTSVVRHAGRVLALMEASPPTEVSLSGDTIGEYRFDGNLRGSMTAHPKIDPVTGEMIFFGYSPMAPYLRVHGATADGVLNWSTEVDLPGPVMMHDFVVTATRVVFFDLPALFNLERMLAGGPGITWAPEHGARIGVLERGAPGSSIRWVDMDPFWVFHFLNAHDEATSIDVDEEAAIVVYGCRAAQLNAGFGPEDSVNHSDSLETAHPVLHRWRIDIETGSVSEERIGDQPGDFPRIDDRRAGLDARYGYVGRTRVFDGVDVEFDGVVKHDLHSGTTESAGYGESAISGEPVFTHDPAADSEDSGWILNWIYDKATEQSAMVVLDAETLNEVARVQPPRRVPFGFHGMFIPTID